MNAVLDFRMSKCKERGRLPKYLMLYIDPGPRGHVAEWLRNGLQNRVHQFNSGRGLHQYNQSFALTICEAARSSSRRPSAGGVPALGKWNKRPGAPVVIGGLRQLVGHRQRRQIIRQTIFLG